MAKKLNLNGMARWIIVALAVAGIIWNTAILHNDVRHLSTKIEELKASYVLLDEKIDKILLSLAERGKE